MDWGASMTIHSTSTLEKALRLASQGVPVFPVSARKVPTPPHGFKDAAVEASEVRELWRRWPAALVGISTGSTSGISALDLDRQHGAAAWWSENRHRLPETRTHRTRSGGLHLLFRNVPALKCSTARIAPGVDVKAENGCLIWWPSGGFPVLADVPICELAEWPPWLFELAMPKPKPSPVFCPEEPAKGSAYARAALRHAAERISRADVGCRNSTLNAEAFALTRFIGESMLSAADVANTLAIAALSAGLEQREVVTTLTSALSAGGVQ